MKASSSPFPIGSRLPTFSLPDVVSDARVSSHAATPRRGVLVMFLCNHCPFVVHVRDEVVRVAHEALDAGIAVFAINANSTKSHPQDGPDAMRRWAETASFRFPFL